MKIYNFTGIISRNHEESIQRYERGTGALKRDRHATDSVEISGEARKRFEAVRVIGMERERTRKIARGYEPVVREILSREEDDFALLRKERMAGLQRAYGVENTVFSDNVLRKVAEMLL